MAGWAPKSCVFMDGWCCSLVVNEVRNKLENFFVTSVASGEEIEICFVTEWFGLMQNMCWISDLQLRCSRDVVCQSLDCLFQVLNIIG